MLKQIPNRWIIIAIVLSLAGCGQASGSTGKNGETTGNSTDSTATNDGSIIFSQSGGLYEQEFTLELSTEIENGIIRYTLDGNDPTNESAQYTVGVDITDRTSEDNLLSAISSGSAGARPGGDLGGEGGAGARPEGDFGDSPGRNTESENFEEKLPPDHTDTKPEDPIRQRPIQADGPDSSGTTTSPAGNVFKGTVVKTAVFSKNGKMLSGISIQSYFVSEDIFTRYGELPIVSLSTDADNFFDSESGIYANYNQSGSDWERPVYFELFESDGTSVVSQKMGVRINGGTTRSLAQKALRFYAKSNYDEENPTIEYELFKGLTTSYSDDLLTAFKRIILRSSGNDNSGSLFRDALMQSLISDLNVDTQASRPCIAFVNGEFWGIYNIRERYDDHYFANHYNIDASNVAVLEISRGSNTPEINEGDEGDLEYYDEMINFFTSNPMTDEANYQKAQEYVDIGNLMDYYIANIYSGNTDWPANNNMFWRYRTENGGYDDTAEWYMDGRFRWIIKDMDWGFGLMTNQTDNTLLHALNESGSSVGGRGSGGFTSAESTLIFRKLLENDKFKSKFINRFCDVMNTRYESDTVITAIEEMKATIEPAIEEQANRYPSSVSSVTSWEASIDKMIQFAQERTGYMQGFLQSRFSLSDVVTVTLNTDSKAGYICINDTDIAVGTKGVSNASSWSGSYFAGTTQTFTAVPTESHTFVKFVVTDTASDTTTEYTDSSINITLGTGETIVETVFK